MRAVARKARKTVHEVERRVRDEIARCAPLIGIALPAYVEWGDLDLSYKVVVRVDTEKCIGCNLCYVACRDTAVACIHNVGEPLAAGHAAHLALRAGASDKPICAL